MTATIHASAPPSGAHAQPAGHWLSPFRPRRLAGLLRLRRHGNHSDGVVTGPEAAPAAPEPEALPEYPPVAGWDRERTWRQACARLRTMPGETGFAGASEAGLPPREFDPAHEKRLASLEDTAGGFAVTTIMDMPPAMARPYMPEPVPAAPAAPDAYLPVHNRLMAEWPGICAERKRRSVVVLAADWAAWREPVAAVLEGRAA